MATRIRLELTTSAVTGRHSNQLNYRAVFQRCKVYHKILNIASFFYLNLN